MTFAPLPGSTAELHNRLQIEQRWGYTIYRTTFSAQADAAFPAILRYLDTCIKKSLLSECASYSENSPGVDPAIYQGIRDKYQSTVIEDAARFAGASMETVRDHFEAFVEGQNRRGLFNSDRMCIVIDEESLLTLLNASVEGLEAEGPSHVHETTRFVKVLEAWPTVDQYDAFPGWMKCSPRALWDLWKMMGDGEEMRNSWEDMDETDEGVYCGP
ncbi:hypothetical protein ASPBRDRAFT_45481 [Aspergillus brasiliensis CBS 101740]|uniref:Uncharacterized protein n=1 Tax=Aspergillus brasiliensis (strain CBS 101740 / IMI 381727 / IBT 21946) TaxID=767769 RepID=A0A1L9UEV4_ASPBC|nr:hypothetical protein ASPBRDRAFT_45481 [Aspergillus brasiliensis CBS 101740]